MLVITQETRRAKVMIFSRMLIRCLFACPVQQQRAFSIVHFGMNFLCCFLSNFRVCSASFEISLLIFRFSVEVLFTTLYLGDETLDETAQYEKKIHSSKESNLIEKNDVIDVLVINGHS